ncbi:unnamed protein product [Rotaria socialis]|uniref:Major facilitator superfamily (MFS) profile domain-containing protein n=1 Tax=Rotaria socialis TaxID=392032 RepID=A0A818EY45_9BILA|nr:unnamed protein product [Rotaria socialis]CAF4506697.1 unnamed protein product [Rotaria socialis]
MPTEKTVVLVDGEARPRLIPSTRFTLALLVFFAFIVQYSQRVNLPIGIVCMIDRPEKINSNLTLNAKTELINVKLAASAQSAIIKRGFLQEKKFLWSELQQQLLLGGYWAGYIFTQIPGGWLATILGVKWVFAGSLGVSSLATLALTVMYVMENTHFITLFVLRVIIGLAHGVLFPATVALWSLWAVPQERSTLASIGFGGTHLGTSFTMLIGGLLCRYLDAGWMYLFIGSSLIGFIWLVLWILFTASSPQLHKTISNHERDYIVGLTGSTGKKRTMSLASIPWKRIVKSKPVVALILTHIANLFGLFFFLTNLGKISTQLLQFSAQHTGYILCFGFFLTYLSSLFAGLVTDHFVQTNKITLTNARRFFNSLASFIPVLCMASFYFCDETQKTLGVITILVFLASSGLPYGSGYVVNFADVVPAFSGVIFGLANTFASLAGLTGNIVAGIIVKQPVLAQWRKLYIMFSVVYLFGGIVYLIYGSGVARKWATFQAVDNDDNQKKKLYDEEAVPMNKKI